MIFSHVLYQLSYPARRWAEARSRFYGTRWRLSRMGQGSRKRGLLPVFCGPPGEIDEVVGERRVPGRGDFESGLL